MQRNSVAVLLLSALFTAAVVGQETTEPATDQIGKEASRLEAELGKYKDTSPAAADIMVKLIDLYHSDGRALGLIRAGQRFAAAHPGDPRHQAAMIKLMDGLEAMSRNQDLASACRQFLARYPKAPQCAQVEVRLAHTLDQMKDRAATADAHRSVWRRQPATPAGQQAGATAARYYAQVGGTKNIMAAAELSEEMLDRLPRGRFGTEMGWHSVNQWRRINEWARSNVVGNKLLKKGEFADREWLRSLHATMAENSQSQGQYANAAQSWQQARTIQDDQYSLYSLIGALYRSEAKAAQLAPLVAEYQREHPERYDRHSRQSLLAHAHLREGDKPRALQLFAPLLTLDAATDSNASVFVRENGAEEAAAKQEADSAVSAAKSVLDSAFKDKTAKEAVAKQAATNLTTAMTAAAKAAAALRADPNNAGLKNADNAAKQAVARAQAAKKTADTALATSAKAAADADSKHKTALARQKTAATALATKYALSERVLRDAIAKNKDHAAYLRYVLAFELYRDRVKDQAKTKQTVRELLTLSPPNDGSSWNALSWLLGAASNENEFRADVGRLIAGRRTYIHLNNYRSYLGGWAKGAAKNKELRPRADYVRAELAKQDNDPVVKIYLQHGGRYNRKDDAAVRDQLLAPQIVRSLSAEQIRQVLQLQGYYYRHYAPSNQRGRCVELYKQLALKFPADYDAAVSYFYAATDYSEKEEKKAAALHLMKLEPRGSSADHWRRLLTTADQNEDVNLVRQAHAWMVKAQQKHGNHSDYASSIGDLLLKHGLEAEAVKHWQTYADYQPNHNESRECAWRLVSRLEEPQRPAFLQKMFARDSHHHGRYAQWLANIYFTSGDLDNFDRVLRETRTRQDQRPYRGWDFDYWAAQGWVDAIRAKEGATDEDKLRVYSVVRDLRVGFASATSELGLLTREAAEPLAPMQRLLAYQRTTRILGNEYYDWDRLIPYAQNALKGEDYIAAATLVTGMLTNITNAGEDRHKVGRDMVAQCYARLGSVGLTIDEDSPIAPLLQAVLYLRLGDESLAYDKFLENKELFDQHRNEVPSDLLIFVAERYIAAGGDENHDYVDNMLRMWQIAHKDSTQHNEVTKAQVQLLVGRNRFKAQHYDIARNEFNTVINLYGETAQAIEAEFGIGETFMAQKVYDQAEAVFEKLATRRETDIVIRAEFLRGVLAFRRGDNDDAREIFRTVLERVPSVELANQALFNLSEVYGVEERYLDQLNLLRTVGRLGNYSKRRHAPGLPLSIVVHDSDLGISRGHSRIKVVVTTVPGGDRETVELTGAGAGKGLFRADLDTQLGNAQAGDNVLQLTGNDVIKCDYPAEFKAEFKNVPLSDVEIRVAASAKFDVSSSKIADIDEESFSEQLEREAREQEEADQRVSQGRPVNQIKPGNPIYLRIKDADRDLSDEADEVLVKLVASSGDQVQAVLKETGSHTGIFEGSVGTAELPAGALASDTSIEHSPLMAIDRDSKTAWVSEPDGATPKTLTIDMKDLKQVSRVKIFTPDTQQNAPIRGELLGSNDGEFWFRLASHPELPIAAPIADEIGVMKRRSYDGNYTRYTSWSQIVELARNGTPIDEAEVEELNWVRPDEDEESERAYAAIWHGWLVQQRDGAARIQVAGDVTALAIDGRVELAPGRGGRSVDLWLENGVHELTIFAASGAGTRPITATIARADLDTASVSLIPFRKDDFDLEQPVAVSSLAAKQEIQHPNDIPLTLAAAKIKKTSESFGLSEDQKLIGGWQDPGDIVSWEFTAAKPGVYDVLVDCAHSGGGSKYAVQFGSDQFDATTLNTGGWSTYHKQLATSVVIKTAGQYTLAIKPTEIGGSGYLMNLRGVSLKPVSGSRRIVRDNAWDIHFTPSELRYVRFVVNEYLGEAVAINHIEVGNTLNDALFIPTETDVLSLANNDELEIAGGDEVTATYTDEFTQRDSGNSQLLTGTLTATYFNGGVTPITYDFARSGGGGVSTTRKELMRVDPGERIVVEIVDYDEDQTAERDTVKFQVMVNDGEPIELEATETGEFTGVFTKEVDTSAEQEDGKLTVKQGDRVFCRYYDRQNTFPGHSVPRESVVYVNEPTDAIVRVLQSRVQLPPPQSDAKPTTVYSTPDDATEVSGVAFLGPFTVEVIDPDQAKDSRSSVVVTLRTTDGAEVKVRCNISATYAADLSPVDNAALLEGRFVGQVLMQLGTKDSPQIVPLTADMPRGLIGGPIFEDEDDSLARGLVTRVLNLTGSDIVTASYHDERTTDEKPADLAARGRLIVDGTLQVTDGEYEEEVKALHVGERLFLRVEDADQDVSTKRDIVSIEITTEPGEKEVVELVETLAHSGVFTGSMSLKASEKPTAGNLDSDDPTIECYFGDMIGIAYLDPAANSEAGNLELRQDVPVVVGTNGLVLAFTKTFTDENLAVETKFHIAESYFELFKSHKGLGRDNDQRADLEAGRRILREVMEDYPDPKYAPRVAYLLGQFSQELGEWDEAIKSYELIIRQFPEHSLAADAQYKLAQSYEEAGDFDQALEGYVTLAATYPKSPLIAKVMIRISDHFFKSEDYEVAAQVGKKFLERFDGHEHAARMAFRVGQCYYKSEDYLDSAEAFDDFVKKFPDDALCASGLFWAGEAYRLGNNNPLAFQRYMRCRGDFPASESAKYARGRLAMPEMLTELEAIANEAEDQ